MKIVVDKIPEKPIECYFSYRNVERGWMCRLLGGDCQAGSDWNECPCLQAGGVELNTDSPGSWAVWGSEFKCSKCHSCNKDMKPWCPNCGSKMVMN